MIRPIGRVRRTLAARLQAELRKKDPDAVVKPRNLFPAKGYWRTDHRADVVRWEGQGKFNGHTVRFYSWEPMSTLITKAGFSLDWENSFTIDVHAGKGDEE